MSSSGYEIDIPRKCIADCEIYDIENKKWHQLPELCNKKSNLSVCALAGTTIVYCFGGWNGKTSTNSIERINIAEYMQLDEASNEVNSDGEELVKQIKSTKMDKNNSERKQIKGTWTNIVLREAGSLETTPNYRLFNSCNSIGCVALDDACIMLFGGKENLKDGETDQCYMFFGANRVKSANPNDHLYEMQKWDKKLSMGDCFGDNCVYMKKDKAVYALSDACFIHYLDFDLEQWELKKI